MLHILLSLNKSVDFMYMLSNIFLTDVFQNCQFSNIWHFLNDDTIDIIWYKGSYSTSCRNLGGSGILEINEKLSNKLTQSSNHLYFYLLSLTANNLQKVTIEKLETEYLPLKQNYGTSTE